jgi:glycosyltransferase involved in cell wall biosynthesis
VHFILCGADATWENGELTRWMDEAGVTQVCRLLGIRSDVSRLTASFDVAASSSVAESFSVSIVEAMSCEVPCVVTDVGDSGMIVGETGRVVPPRNPDALAAELEAVLALDGQARRQLGQAARRRIAENFDLPSTVKKYESIYEGLAQHVWH